MLRKSPIPYVVFACTRVRHDMGLRSEHKTPAVLPARFELLRLLAVHEYRVGVHRFVHTVRHHLQTSVVTSRTGRGEDIVALPIRVFVREHLRERTAPTPVRHATVLDVPTRPGLYVVSVPDAPSGDA